MTVLKQLSEQVRIGDLSDFRQEGILLCGPEGATPRQHWVVKRNHLKLILSLVWKRQKLSYGPEIWARFVALRDSVSIFKTDSTMSDGV